MLHQYVTSKEEVLAVLFDFLEQCPSTTGFRMDYDENQIVVRLTEESPAKQRDIAEDIVPAELMEKYHELSDRRLRGKLTETEISELQQVKEEIEKIEANHPVLQVFEQQNECRHQQMMKSLEDIGNNLKTLADAVAVTD